MILESVVRTVLDLFERDPNLAARLRAVLGIDGTAEDGWIPLSKAPLARKTIRRLARTGTIASKKVAGRLYVSQTSLDAFMRGAEKPCATPDDEDALRTELGLRRAS